MYVFPLLCFHRIFFLKNKYKDFISSCSLLDSPVTKLFEKKGSVIALPPNDLANPTEASIGHAIEAGAEEVQPTGDDDQSLEVSLVFLYAIFYLLQYHN